MARLQNRWSVLLLVLGLTWAGCATDRVTKDLAGYVNQGVLRIAELERVALEKYSAVTGPNFTTSERLYKALRDDVVPLYGRFLRGLRDLQPETQEVRDLHRMYIRAAESLYEGFREKMWGVEKEDEIIIRAANSKIEKGRIENEKWREELIALAEKHGLKQEQK